MRTLRGIAVLLPQLLIILYLGGRYDLLAGFNRTDAGLMTLLLLFVLGPVITLLWLTAESISGWITARRQGGPFRFRLPAVAFLFFLESLAIDLFILSQFRM